MVTAEHVTRRLGERMVEMAAAVTARHAHSGRCRRVVRVVAVQLMPGYVTDDALHVINKKIIYTHGHS